MDIPAQYVPIMYMLLAWAAILGTAKALRLDRRGMDLTPYSLVYKNPGVQDVLVRILGRTRRGIRVFADVSVVAGFLMMGFAFWFLIDNVIKYFVEPENFAELTILIPGVTLVSFHAIVYFLLSIPIVLVMHEGAHGIVAALERIRIKNGGFAIFVSLVAGFVEPDEEEFERARKVSRLRVIGAGATSNVLFAMALGALLLTNPAFALVLPEPLLGAFYESSEGVMVNSVMEGMGAEAAGIMAGDVITEVGGMEILRPEHFADLGLAPGETVSVSILRDGIPMEFMVDIMESPEEPDRGLIGILRDNTFSYKPVLDFIQWGDPSFSLFLLWLWMISFFIGVLNMLPLPILDGGKFIHTIIEGRMAERTVTKVMYTVYVFTFVIFALNLGLTFQKVGWITL